MARLIKTPGKPDRYEYSAADIARVRAWQEAMEHEHGDDGEHEDEQAQRNSAFLRSERYP